MGQVEKAEADRVLAEEEAAVAKQIEMEYAAVEEQDAADEAHAVRLADLEVMKGKELKKECEAAGLEPKGKAEELLARLVTVLEESKADADGARDMMVRAGRRRQEAEAVAAQKARLTEAHEARVDAIRGMKKGDLVKEMKELNIDWNGKQGELMERLIEVEEVHTHTPCRQVSRRHQCITCR